MAAKTPRRDLSTAHLVIDFIEKLYVPSGVGAGERFRLRGWQKRFIINLYAKPRGAKSRPVERAVLSVARKNGKTALIACLVLAHLVGPVAELNGEIYSAANERDQAAIVFKMVTQIIALTPGLQKRLVVTKSTKTVGCPQFGTFYKAISAEAGSKHGFNPTLVIYDELAQAKKRDLFDALDTALGARENPLLIIISTQSPDPKHVLSEMIDDGLNSGDPSVIADLHEVPMEIGDVPACISCDREYPHTKDDDDPLTTCPICGEILRPAFYREKYWKLANPALGDFRMMKDMRNMARRAMRMPSFESTFRNLYLNQRIDSKPTLITRADWEACAGEFDLVLGERIYLGLDLSATNDLTALVAVTEDGARIKSWFWKPAASLPDHAKRDFVPYGDWERTGHLFTTPGRTVAYEFIAEFIGELDKEYEIAGIAYDRWRIDNLIKELDRADIEAHRDGEEGDGIRLVPWGQGFRDMGPAIDEMEKLILEGSLKHDRHPVLTWNISNSYAIVDPAGNRKIDKSASRFRIDGAVAMANAVGLRARDLSDRETEEASVYESEEFVI